ncbi:MAG: transporter substrate-binding domain-containing protein [Anaerolineae bacterium]|nr:transporter substrate-binding domain-containing protein [Anaerolineae bacterium]
MWRSLSLHPWARRLTVVALIALTLVAAVGSAHAAGPARQDAKKLRVATKIISPFVMQDKGQFTGYSIDLWKAVAGNLKLDYEWVEVKTVSEQLQAVQQGDADVAIAAISMTPQREQVIDFSHPYYNAGLQIMTQAQGQSILPDFRPFLTSPALRQIVLLGIITAIVMSHVIWLVERNGPNDFPKSYFAGIAEGLWWLLNIVANGEYGDKMTRRWIPRLVTIMFWLIGIALIAQFTASVTTAMTVQQLTGSINSPADLPGKKVATVAGTTAAQYLDGQNINYQAVAKIEDAYALLKRGDVQAVVYDAPVLAYYANTEGRGEVQVVGGVFKEETYGIVLPTGSPLRKTINEALLQLRQDGTLDDLQAKYFGDAGK